jgi:hypothetical protein
MSAKILFRDAQGRDGAVELRMEPVYVGRAVECAIRTDDAMVSRKHSMVRFEGGRYWVEDLGSSNGTHVNDVKVAKQVLAHNDVVRCGSLWLRYIEEGPLPQMAAPPPPPPMQPMGPPPTQAAMNPPQGYGQPGGYGQPQPGGYGQQPQGPPPNMYGQPGGMGGMAGPTSMPQPMGPPPMGPGSMGPGRPPGQDLGFASTVATSTPARIPSTPYGQPSPMQQPARPGPSVPSVEVNLNAGNSGPAFAPAGGGGGEAMEKLRNDYENVRQERDKEIAENKRLRAEHATLQKRIEDTRTQLKEGDEVVEAHKRVAEELRIELDQAKDELAKATQQLTETSEDLASRSRQLTRAQEDVAKAKNDAEQQKKQLAELAKMKDDGWKKVNEQVAEVEHLREVIREQERILEERRVGLISLEEALKELRQERESRLKELAQVKAERDQIRANLSVFDSNVRALEEENRRLARLIGEGDGGGSGDAGEIMRMSGELKDLRVELKKQEAEKIKFSEALDRSEQRAEKLSADLARLEVEGSSGGEKMKQVEAARQRADEARAKAEAAKQKAEEDRDAAMKARDQALEAADKDRVEAERMRRKMADFEFEQADKAAAAGAGDAGKVAVLEEEKAGLARRVQELEKQLAEAPDVPAAAPAPSGDGGGGGEEIKAKAGEVYQSINDVLADLRMNVNMAKEELAAFAGDNSDPRARTILDAIESAVGQVEDVKGVLRGLRELAES